MQALAKGGKYVRRVKTCLPFLKPDHARQNDIIYPAQIYHFECSIQKPFPRKHPCQDKRREKRQDEACVSHAFGP